MAIDKLFWQVRVNQGFGYNEEIIKWELEFRDYAEKQANKEYTGSFGTGS